MTEILASGEDDVSVAELASRAGVSKRTVYQHFPDKEARIKAINDWVEDLIDVGMMLPKGFDDIPAYFERRIDYVFTYEKLVRVIMESRELLKEVRELRKQVHMEHLEKALSERIKNPDLVDELVGFLLATMNLGSIYDMRDLYGMTEDAIKARYREMVEALLEKYA